MTPQKRPTSSNLASQTTKNRFPAAVRRCPHSKACGQTSAFQRRDIYAKWFKCIGMVHDPINMEQKASKGWFFWDSDSDLQKENIVYQVFDWIIIHHESESYFSQNETLNRIAQSLAQVPFPFAKENLILARSTYVAGVELKRTATSSVKFMVGMVTVYIWRLMLANSSRGGLRSFQENQTKTCVVSGNWWFTCSWTISLFNPFYVSRPWWFRWLGWYQDIASYFNPYQTQLRMF